MLDAQTIKEFVKDHGADSTATIRISRAGMIYQEEKDRITNKFNHPFRKRKPWRME